MHVTGADFESVVDGMLIPADAGPLTASNVVGIWRSRINRDECLGLYDDLDQCTRTMTFTLLADGSGTQWIRVESSNDPCPRGALNQEYGLEIR